MILLSHLILLGFKQYVYTAKFEAIKYKKFIMECLKWKAFIALISPEVVVILKFYNNNIKKIKVISAVLSVVYLLLLAYLTLVSKYYGRELEHSSINIIPLRTIIEFLTSGYNLKTITTNLLGNIAAFMPMGFLLPIVFNKLNRLRKVIYISFIASLMIEIMQYILSVGASDIDDVILNVLGAVLGYWIMRCVRLFILKLIS